MRRTTYLLACLLLCLVTLTAATPPTAVFQEEPLPPPSEPIPTMTFQPPSDADEVIDFVPAGGQLLNLSSASTAQRLALPTADEDVTVSIDNGRLAVVVEEASFADPVELEVSGLQVTPVVSTTAESVAAWLETLEDGEMVEPSNLPTTLVQFQLELFSAKTGEQMGEFDHPVRLMVDLRELGLTEEQIASPNFYLAYRDENDPNLWRDVPITIHQEEGLISAELTHFSDWTAGWRPSAWAPSWTLPAVSEFSGAATYSYPIEVPPGRGGLQPNLALSYSSRSLDGAIRSVSQGNVASGWSIGDSYIIREGGGLEWGSGTPYGHFTLTHKDNYRLVLNGVGYELIAEGSPSNPDSMRYYAKNMPSLKVVRLYYPIGSSNQAPNEEGLFWSVTTPDGTKYRFGYFNDSEAWARTEHPTLYNWEGHQGHQVVGDISPVSSRTSTYAWYLDTVTDVHGNQMTYTYESQVGNLYACDHGDHCGHEGLHYRETVRLKEIAYNYPTRIALPPTGVVPNNVFRGITNPPATPATKIVFGTDGAKRINLVSIYHGSLAEPQKEYLFTIEGETSTASYLNCSYYNGNNVDYPTLTVNVTKIQERVGSYTLPATILDYQTYAHLHRSGDPNRPCFGYSYLKSVENGYGGKVEFNYVSDGRSVGDYYYQDTGVTGYYVWPDIGFSYSVNQVTHWDRGTAVQQIDYAYTAPCYNQTTALSHPSGATTCPSGLQYPEYGPLVGYATTTSTIRVPNGEQLVQNYTKFYQHDPVWWDNLVGKPQEQETRYKVSTTGEDVFRPFSRTVTVYDSKPFGPNLPFVFAQKISQYQYSNYDSSGNNPKVMSSKTEYAYETTPQGGHQWGMVTKVQEYATAEATTPTRITNTWYAATPYDSTTDYRWMIKPAAVGVSDWFNGSERLLAGTWNYYDDATTAFPAAGAPTLKLGHLTRTRQFSPNTSCVGPITNCVATIETKIVYGDDFGNVTETWSYQGYGYVINNGSSPWGEGAAPSSAALKTIITYETGFYLYPVAVQNPANQITSFAIYGFNYPIPSGGFMKQNGLLARVEAPNGVRNWYEYDPFGRLFATYETYKVAGETTPTPPTNFGLGTPSKTDGNPTQRYHYYDNGWQGIQLPSLNNKPFVISTFTHPATYHPNTGGTGYNFHSLSYFDGFGRVIQAQERTVAVDNSTHDKRIIVNMSYDALGQLSCQSVPYAVANAFEYVNQACGSSPSGKTLTTYGYTSPSDALIHPSDTLVTAPDGTTSKQENFIIDHISVGINPVTPTSPTDNRLLAQKSTDASGRFIIRLTNVWGQLVKVREFRPEDITGANPYGAYADTDYFYDARGNLGKVQRRTWGNTPVADTATTAILAVTTMSYDGWGRKTGMTDPDMGTWSYAYDAAGNLTRQLDGKNQALCFYYDTLNRLTTKGFPASGTTCPTTVPTSSNSHWLATYTYATSGTGIGQLTNTSWRRNTENNTGVDSETLTYDSWGRLATHSRTLDGQPPYTMSYQYDVLHRPTTITYPNGHTTTTLYDRQGENQLKLGNDNLVSGITHNALGQPLAITRPSAVNTSFSYHSLTQRLTNITHGVADDLFADYSFQYDNIGNITSKIESLHPTQPNLRQAETFTYDGLNRLLTASAAEVTGMADPYSHRYVYDQLGNIMALGNITSNGTMTTTYGYHATQKHAVVSTTAPVNGQNMTETFAYDANGNMIARQSGDYTHTFDRENRLVKVVNGSQTTQFRYDASGQRTITIEPNGSITYTPFPGYEEELGQLPAVTSLTAGGETTLYTPINQPFHIAWASTDAESCTATGEGWNGSKLPNGNEPITLTSVGTRTYTLTCHSEYGDSTTAQITVHAGELPTVTLTADNQGVLVVPVHQAFPLAWSSTNASSCTSNWTTSTATSGTQQVALNSPQTRTYTRTCSNAFGSTTSAVVSVEAVYAPTVNISATPNPVSVGQQFTLEWDSQYATGNCTASGAWAGANKSLTGTENFALPFANSYTYIIQCSNAHNMTTTAQVTVVVTALPYLNFTVNGQNSATVPPSQSYTLAWNTLNVTSCTATGAWAGSKPTSGSSNDSRKAYGLYSYTLTCINAANSFVSKTVTVTVEDIQCPGGCGGGETQLPTTGGLALAKGMVRARLALQAGGGQVRIQRATYFLGGQAIALQVTGGSPQDGLYYILGDQLGSANTLVKDTAVVSQQRFLPFGEKRGWNDEAVAPWQNRGYTGHLHNDEVGLIYMNARYYVPSLGRFASADTLIPNPVNPQAFNRFSYTYNNPLNYTDPSGHDPANCADGDVYCVAQYYGYQPDWSKFSSDPFQDVLNYTLYLLGKTKDSNANYTDADALIDILTYSLNRAGGDLALASTYIASVFYRESEFSAINTILENSGRTEYMTNGQYDYKKFIDHRFGATGFYSSFQDSRGLNGNQVEHFFGEMYVNSISSFAPFGTYAIAIGFELVALAKGVMDYEGDMASMLLDLDKLNPDFMGDAAIGVVAGDYVTLHSNYSGGSTALTTNLHDLIKNGGMPLWLRP